MPSSAVLDLEPLLQPITGDKPAGESVRYDGVYDAIQAARREEDALPMGDWEREVKSADWNAVIELATDAIGKKSKDLQIAVWLVEALTKKHGFGGLSDGFQLLRDLQENFWDGLFPEIEDGDLEFRASPLHWLNEKLPACIKQIPITNGSGQFCWFQWEDSRKVDNLGRQDAAALQAALADGRITGERFDLDVEATPRPFYEALFEGLSLGRGSLAALEKVVNEKFAPVVKPGTLAVNAKKLEAPSLLGVRKALDDCYGLINGIVMRKRAQDPAYKSEIAAAGPEQGAVGTDVIIGREGPARAPASVSWSGEPRSRDEAFQQLMVISAYLKRAEPQHPVTYLLDRALRWTKMPLEEWLTEVIRNDEVLQHLRDTLGIKLPS